MPDEAPHASVDPRIGEGIQLQASGDLDAAEASYKAVLEEQPDHADVHYLLSLIKGQRGELDEAKSLLERALAFEPDSPAYLVALGNVHRESGEREEAVRSYRRALEIDPGELTAKVALAYVSLDLGHESEGLEYLTAALEQEPGSVQDRLNLAKLLADRNRHQEAIAHYTKAVELAPELALGHHLLAYSLGACGRFEDACVYYEKAIELSPGDAVILNDFGLLLRQFGYPAQAKDQLSKSVELAPTLTPARVNLGNTYLDLKNYSEAIRCYEKALELEPKHASANNNIGSVLKDCGRVKEAVEYFRKAISADRSFPMAESNLLLSLQYLDDVSLDELREAHADWVERWTGKLAPSTAAWVNTPDPDRPIRVGYVSPDFHAHPIGYFLEPVFADHDRSKFHLTCYYDYFVSDDLTERFKSLADEWRSIAGASHSSVMEMIRKDRIDILVDMAGHTASNRMQMFAERAAPVQATWIGYLHSTGLAQMDYLLADAVAVPPDTLQTFTEQVVRLPGSFLCYGSPADTPEVAETPAFKNGYVTFGCFNNLAKISDKAIRTWARILEQRKDARLVLKNQAFNETELRQSYLEKLVTLRIPESRVSLEPRSPRGEYFASYHSIDIALDPFPFSGGTISSDALWMGVPVVTLAGDRMASRTSASMLSCLGLDELVTHTSDDYVRVCVDLAQDTDRLQRLRGGMRRRFNDSTLGNTETFTRNLESAYRQMWQTWCRAQS